MSSPTTLGWSLAACVLTAACHNRRDSSLNIVGPTASGLGNHVAYVDADRSGTVNQGDELWMRFNQALTFGAGVPDVFELPVDGDGLGTPLVSLAQSPGLVRVVLGQQPGLRGRGVHFGQLDGNQPSGLRVAEDAPAGALVSANNGLDVVRGGLALDIVPEFRRGADRPASEHVVSADLDCDGDLDLVTVRPGPSASLVVELQSIDGSFLVVYDQPTGDEIVDLLLLDANQDARPDVVYATAEGEVFLARNTGSAPGMLSFPVIANIASNFFTGLGTVATSDANSDGDPDLWLGTDETLLLALGASEYDFEFPVAVGAPTADYAVLAVGDLDRNGTQDLFAGGENGDRILSIGSGGQVVAVLERSGDGLPLTQAAQIGDLNSDGRPDIVLGTEEALLYWRQLPGGFEPQDFVSIATGAPTRDLALVDLDGDSALDLVRLDTSDLEVFGGDGLGDFTRAPRTRNLENARGFATGDFDNDGDIDALVAGAPSGFWFGSALGTFGSASFADEGNAATSDVFPGTGQTLDVLHGDLDGDGDLDAVSSGVTLEGGRLQTWRNVGAGNMQPGQTLEIGLDRADSIALTDLDGDGHLDLFAAAVGDSSHVWLGLGDGTFPPQSTPVAPNGQGSGLGVGDLDNDGDMDVVLGTVRFATNRVLLNGGTVGTEGDGGGGWAGFDSQFLFTNQQHTNDVLVHDLDCDGDLDLVFAHGQGGLDTVWRNTLESGALGFEQVEIVALEGLSVPTVAVRALDVNLDGAVDLVFGNRTGVRIYFGDGELTPSSYTLGFIVPGGGVTALDLDDVDGDGFQDLVIGSDVGVRLRVNRGLPGSFENSPSQSLPFGSVSSISLGDRTGDGALDLYVGERTLDAPNGSYRNE